MDSFFPLLSMFLPQGRSRRYWIIQAPDGNCLEYTQGLQKGQPKLFKSIEKAQRTLRGVRRFIPDAKVIEWANRKHRSN